MSLTKSFFSRLLDHILSFLLIGCLQLLCAASLNTVSVNASSLKPPPAPNTSRLIVRLQIKDGRLTVDRTASSLEPSPEFTTRLKISIDRARKILFDDLDEQLISLGRPYYNSLSDTEKELDDQGKINDPQTNKIRTFSGSWTDFRALFNAWVASGTDRNPFEITLSQIKDQFTNFANQTAILFDPDDVTLWKVETGEAIFNVVDPITNWNSDEYSVTLPDTAVGGSTVANIEEIKKEALSPLVGRLWRASEIRSRIEIYYARRGLTPIITLSSTRERPITISIRESLRIARIVFPVIKGQEDDIDKILYYLLSDKEFRIFRRDRDTILNSLIAVPGQPGFSAIDYVTHLKREANKEPYVNTRQIQIQQLQLADLGYYITPSPSISRPQPSGITYVDMVVQKQAKTETSGAASAQNSIKPPAPAANEQGVVGADLSESGPLTTPPAKAIVLPPALPAEEKIPKEPALQKERKNYIGGGLEYRPGQGIRTFGLYQRSKIGFLSANDKFSIKAGGQGEALGDINYYADFVLFRNLPYKLSVQFTGATDFTSNRFLNSTSVDERRTGGLARVSLELFRDRNGSLLRLYAEGRNTTVALVPKDQATIKQNLNTIDLGGLYFYQSGADNKYSRLIRLVPQLRFGLGLAANEASFKKFTIKGDFNQELPKLLAINISGRAETSSVNTPLFEQPSLGGAEVLRGFRTDDAIGRHLWALQNNLLFPVPGTSKAVEGASLFLQQKVRLAGFFDIGNLYRTTGSQLGLRKGVGFGVRLNYYPIQLGVDWAYGFGPAATTDHGRGRIYFTVKTFLPE